MRTRFFAELTTAPPAPGTPPEPSHATFLVIESTSINTILHAHNIHGVLLEDSIHPTIDAARAAAAKRFGTRLGTWAPVPFEAASIHDMLSDRRARLIASGVPIDLTLDYHRPRKYFKKAYWWRGFAIYAGMQTILLLTFGFIFLRGSPLASFLLQELFDQRGTFATLFDIVLLALFAACFVWTFPRVHGTLTGLAICIMGFQLLIILTLGLRDFTTAQSVIAYVTSIPFILFALWRCLHITNRWIEEE